MGVFLAFLVALFVPVQQGSPSVFDTIIATLFDIWYGVADVAPKAASFIDQIPA